MFVLALFQFLCIVGLPSSGRFDFFWRVQRLRRLEQYEIAGLATLEGYFLDLHAQ